MAEESGVTIPEKGILVGADLNQLISAIHLAPAVDVKFRYQIESLIASSGFKFPVYQSEMDDKALF